MRRLLPDDTVFLNNREWLEPLTAIELLRDVGKHFPMGYMLAKESVRARVHGEGMTFTEFSYMVLQSYDYQQLHDRYDCRLQMGGSDQWGNITAGIELIRRTRNERVHGLTTPLLLRADGQKFGKSEEGAIFLDRRAHVAVRVLPVLPQHRGRPGRDAAAPADALRARGDRARSRRPRRRRARPSGRSPSTW